MKNKIFNILAIFSTLGILAWIITDYYGGMVLYLFSFWPVIITIIILYVISFFDTIISCVIKGWKPNKIKVTFHCSLLLIIAFFNLSQSELFKSRRILTAVLKDDLYRYILVLREKGKCEIESFGIFGFYETFSGRYIIKEDKLIFQKKPYDNDFIPDTLLIDKKQNAIFLSKDKNGNFSKTISFLNHFKIIDYEE